MPSSGQQYRTLQAGRGISAFAIVLHHTFAVFAGLLLGVAYFFVLSGAVMLLAHRRDIGRAITVFRFAAKRFLRIYPLYWLVLLPYVLHPSHLPTAVINHPYAILTSFSLAPMHPESLLLGVAWTLQHEVIFYMLFALLLVSAQFGKWVFAIWLVGSLLDLFHVVPGPWAIVFSELHLLFALGMVSAALLQRGAVPWPRLLTVVGGTVLLATIAAITVVGQRLHHVQLYGGLGAASLMLGTATLEQQGRLRVPGWLNTLGAASYSIYLVHLPILALLGRHTALLHRSSGAAATATLSAMCAFSIGVGLVVHWLVEAPLLRLFARSRYTDALRADPLTPTLA